MNEPSDRTRRVALALYALCTLLVFPHELPGGGSIDLGLLIVWLVPAALAIGIEGRSVREAGWAAFLASLAGHVLLFHWFYVVTVSYGGMPAWLGFLSPLVPAFWVSLFSALFAMGWAQLRIAGRDSIPVGAALWVVVDWGRAHFLGGFPWATWVMDCISTSRCLASHAGAVSMGSRFWPPEWGSHWLTPIARELERHGAASSLSWS